MKRKRVEVEGTIHLQSPKKPSTPSKARSRQEEANGKHSDDDTPSAIEARSKETHSAQTTSKANGDFTTPKKQARFPPSANQTPTRTSHNELPATAVNADRSARRKSNRLLIKHAQDGQVSDDQDSQDEALAQEIFDEEEDLASGPESAAGRQDDDRPLHNTTTKRPRGRRKANTKQRTPSPPPDLPAHERYFFQNRPGGSKASDNTLPASALLTHETYYEAAQAYKDPHEPELDFLHALHSRSFDQWIFEWEKGFNICLYGWGSKRELMLDFASHISSLDSKATIVVLNGYDNSISLRDVFTTIASTIPGLASSNQKLGSQPADMLSTILAAVSKDAPHAPITLILHSIDGSPLRRGATQSLLGRLTSHPSFRLIASADTPNFPLLWDASLRAQFNWAFHDCTTYQPFDVEISGSSIGGVVDEVNTLLGRSGRKMHGREGVMYVLKSLTQSARSLYVLLVAELIALDESGDGVVEGMEADEDEEDDFEDAVTPGRPKSMDKTRQRPAPGGGMNAAIEWRSLYQKSVSQFIATNEMSFRGLLKEFHDHEMVVSRKDAMGSEMLSVPFRKEDLVTLLEELSGDA